MKNVKSVLGKMANCRSFCYAITMVKAIYFDYHGVLDQRNFQGLLEVLAQAIHGGDRQRVIAEVRNFAYDYATGKTSPHDFWHQIEGDYGSIVERAGRDYQLHVQPNVAMWSIVSSLKDRFTLGLCTDCATDKKEVIRSAYALTEFFDNLIFTCDVGLSKHDPELYQLMLWNNKFRPEECLLIDDALANVQQAIAVGFQAHQFTTAEELQHFLTTLS